MSDISVGSAVKKMDLPLGLDLTGYIARENNGATGVNDELMIKCIVIGKHNEAFAFVCCELAGLSADFTKGLIKAAAQRVSIPEANIIVNCTHTHSGPASIIIENCGDVNKEWLKGLEETIIGCIVDASQKLEPAYLTYKTGTCDIGFNRVGNTLQNTIALNEENTDKQIGVLTFYSSNDDEIIAVMVNFACHPVVLTHTNMLYSADYPHYMEEALKRHLKRDVNVIFINGCCGDIDPIKRGSFELAEEAGEQLAKDILNIEDVNYSTKNKVHTVLNVKAHKIKIPIVHNLNEDTLLKLLVEFKRCLNNMLTERDYISIKVYKAYITWVEKMINKISTNTLEDFVEADIKVIKLGILVFVSLPFETFHDIGLKIKKQFGVNNTIIASYANGCFGYLASREQYKKSKYEIEEAFRFYGLSGPFSENAEDLIYQTIFDK